MGFMWVLLETNGYHWMLDSTQLHSDHFRLYSFSFHSFTNPWSIKDCQVCVTMCEVFQIWSKLSFVFISHTYVIRIHKASILFILDSPETADWLYDSLCRGCIVARTMMAMAMLAMCLASSGCSSDCGTSDLEEMIWSMVLFYSEELLACCYSLLLTLIDVTCEINQSDLPCFLSLFLQRPSWILVSCSSYVPRHADSQTPHANLAQFT